MARVTLTLTEQWLEDELNVHQLSAQMLVTEEKLNMFAGCRTEGKA